MTVKIECTNGTVHVLSVREAAEKIEAFGLTVGEFPEALSWPFNVDFPWQVDLLQGDEPVGILAGGYQDIRALQ